MITKIRINHDLWMFFNNGKIVVGGGTLPTNIHLTLHYGGRSGIVDVHLQNEKITKYYSIVSIDSADIEEALRIIVFKAKEYLIGNMTQISKYDFRKKYNHFYPGDLDFNLSEMDKKQFEAVFEFQLKKKTLHFNIPEKIYRSLGLKMARMFERWNKKLNRVRSAKPKYGIVIDKYNRLSIYFIEENQILIGNLESIGTEQQLLNHIFGNELWEKIKSKFHEGISYIADEKLAENKRQPIKIKILNIENETVV